MNTTLIYCAKGRMLGNSLIARVAQLAIHEVLRHFLPRIYYSFSCLDGQDQFGLLSFTWFIESPARGNYAWKRNRGWYIMYLLLET